MKVKTRWYIYVWVLIFGHVICYAVTPDNNAVASFTYVANDASEFLVVGEELIYNVSYASIDIGQIRLKVVEKVVNNGKTAYRATANIDSYKGIPFVDLHVIYESLFENIVATLWFHARLKNNTRWSYINYDFNYERQCVYTEEGVYGTNEVLKYDSIKIDTHYQDGLSLLYMARMLASSKQKITIPTMIDKQKASTYINFTSKRSGESIKAIDYPVDVVQLEGKANFMGIFGLTGEFKGWFSNDEARVPILAKMKVIIGDVRIELMKWSREGWYPPKFVYSK